MSEPSTAVSRFINEWECGRETSRSFEIELQNPDSERVSELFSEVDNLTQHFDPNTIHCSITGGEDKYSARYEPANSLIHSKQEKGSEYDLQKLYPSDSDFVGRVEKLRDSRLRNLEELIETIDAAIGKEEIDVEINYQLEKSRVANCLADTFDLQDIGIEFHVTWEKFGKKLNDVPPEKFQETFLQHEKLLIVVHDRDEFLYGDNLAISGIGVLDQFVSDFKSRQTTWRSSQSDIAPNALIDDIDRKYVAPMFFDLNRVVANTSFQKEVVEIFSPHLAVYSLLSLASRAEHIDESKWHIRISGKQYIEGTFSLNLEQSLIEVESEDNGEDERIAIDNALAQSLYSLHRWAYSPSERIENRVTVLRNVSTLFARDLADLVRNAQEIKSSAESNEKYYLEQSIDEFFEFRREAIDSAFQTHDSFSSLRSELMDGLSRDIFRTVTFLVAIIASTYLKLGDQFGTDTVLTLILMFILGYVIITFRRIRGVQAQFRKLIEDRENSIQFYGNFFDKDELSEYGLNSGSESPWWGSLFDRWIDQGFKLEYVFLLDLSIYYALIASITIVSSALLIDIHIHDFIQQIP